MLEITCKINVYALWCFTVAQSVETDFNLTEMFHEEEDSIKLIHDTRIQSIKLCFFWGPETQSYSLTMKQAK